MVGGDLYYIRGLRMAEALIRRGFNMNHIEDNRNDSYLKVIVFKNSPELQKAIAEISDELNKKK